MEVSMRGHVWILLTLKSAIFLQIDRHADGNNEVWSHLNWWIHRFVFNNYWRHYVNTPHRIGGSHVCRCSGWLQ